MELIQDEDLADGRKSSVKRTHESTYKPSKKWTYNEIYMSPPKYETQERSSRIEEYSKYEKNIESKHSYNGIHLPCSKYEAKEKSNNIDESSKYEGKESIEVD